MTWLRSLDFWWFHFVTEASAWWHALLLFPLGWLVGQRLWWWSERMAQDLPFGRPACCRGCGQPHSLATRMFGIACPACGRKVGPGREATSLLTAIAFVLLAGSLSHWKGQSLTEGGSIDWYHYRLCVQLVLVSLLVAATVIDWQCTIIPDEITIPGMIIGIATAVAFGNLQFVPVWLDWNDPLVRVYGPAIPQWIKANHHWHGMVYSVAGLLAGAGLTWLVRIVSAVILRQEALGFGDVTLMAMIGAFLGWQPVVLVFLLAPLCGLAIGLIAWLTTRHAAVPYGPYLSAATLVVLLAWRWLWLPTRKIFSDVQGLAILFGIMAAGLVVLLGLVRLYRLIPVESRRYRR